MQAATSEQQKAGVICAKANAALMNAKAVVVVSSQRVSGYPHLMPRRWRAAIAWHSVWRLPVHVLEPVACGQPAGCQASCLHASWTVEAHRGHDCRAEEDQVGSDRLGSCQHWTTNFARLRCLSGGAGRIPPHASPCRCPGS